MRQFQIHTLLLLALASGAVHARNGETASSTTCTDASGKVIISSRGWFSTGTSDSSITLPKTFENSYFSWKKDEKSIVEIDRADREGFYGPIEDVTYTQKAVITEVVAEYIPATADHQAEYKRTEIGSQPVDLLCRQFSGLSREMSPFGIPSTIATSEAILEILAKYPTTGAARDNSITGDTRLSQLRRSKKTYEIEGVSVTIDDLNLDISKGSASEDLRGYGFYIKNGNLVNKKDLDRKDRNFCNLSVNNYLVNAGETQIKLNESGSELKNVDTVVGKTGKLYSLEFYFNLDNSRSMMLNYRLAKPFMHVECYQDLTVDQLSQIFGGKLKISSKK